MQRRSLGDLFAALWTSSSSGDRRCAHCTQRCPDNSFIDSATAAAQVCRRCYDALSITERVRFDVSLRRPPVFSDYFDASASPRSLYGDDVIYYLVWALSKRLPQTLVRAIVEAPIGRVDTPLRRDTTFFGTIRVSITPNDAKIQTCLYWTKDRGFFLGWYNGCFVRLTEFSASGATDGIKLEMDYHTQQIRVFDDNVRGIAVISRRRRYDEDAAGYIVSRFLTP